MAQIATVNGLGQIISDIMWFVDKQLPDCGERITSNKFILHNHVYSFSMYPDRNKDVYKIGLCFVEEAKSELICVASGNLYSCHVSLQGNSEMEIIVAKDESVKKLFCCADGIIGNFNMHSTLLNEKQVNSSLVIELKFYENKGGKVNGDLTLTSESTLVQNLENLFLSERETDISIKVKEFRFNSHRSILAARSEVFAAMLQQDMTENRSGEIEINDCDPDCFKIFLRYLYTEKTDLITVDNALGLYYIADKYFIEKLKKFCAQCLMQNFRTDLICDVLVLAKTYDDTKLLEAATRFFCENAAESIRTPQWTELQKKNLTFSNDLFLEILDKLQK